MTHLVVAHHSRQVLLVAVCLALTIGCDRAPAEPGPSKRPAQSAPKPDSLKWDAPATWTLDKSGEKGRYRAKYSIQPRGDDKHPAEMLVTKLPKNETLESELTRISRSFEKKLSPPKRQNLKAGAFQATLVDLDGTYKMGMGPVVPGSRGKRQAAYVLQEGWYGLAAGVDAGTKGRWLFRLVGPRETVQAARSPMLVMLRNLK